MVSSRLLAIAGVILGAILLLGRGRGQDSGQDSASGTVTVPVGGNQPQNSDRNIVLDLVDNSPLPDAPVEADPPVSPGNSVTEGAIWQGPDPLDLAPGEDGRGDAVAPINPGNAIMSGPVYTGPDPFGLGGE